MKKIYWLIYLISIFSCEAQSTSDSTILFVKWEKLAKGVQYTEIDAPKKAIVGDSKISILQMNPAFLDFYLLSATEFGGKSKTAEEWAKEQNVQIVFNAGMYSSGQNYLKNKGFMKNYTHFNNPIFDSTYNGIFACNPIDSLHKDFTLVDATCHSWDSVQTHYHSFAQGMRMIGCGKNPLNWNKKEQFCSMGICAMDKNGLIYFIFTRSPYTHNEMIDVMMRLETDIVQAVYLEGGPETSLYLEINGKIIKKFGSYISKSYPNDLNDHFWKIPNVIGVKIKK